MFLWNCGIVEINDIKVSSLIVRKSLVSEIITPNRDLPQILLINLFRDNMMKKKKSDYSPLEKLGFGCHVILSNPLILFP